MKHSNAEIVREYGPFPNADRVDGVTYDGQQVWFASGDKLNAFDPSTGKAVRSFAAAAHAGSPFGFPLTVLICPVGTIVAFGSWIRRSMIHHSQTQL